ncbi:MAG: type III-B CRISPR module-associated protein Cmr5 [Methanophagales archaeon]|nr:type III-B CRISPR module-associated protein Cmr5 [Methanophagales archaeon]
MNDLLRSLEQERAKFAFESIFQVKERGEEDRELEKKYRSHVRSASTLILTNGLGNALAFYQSKFEPGTKIETPGDVENFINRDNFNNLKPEKRSYALLYFYLSKWLAGKGSDQVNVTEGNDPLQWAINNATSLEVLQATQETLALLNWMKRFAQAILEEEKEEE